MTYPQNNKIEILQALTGRNVSRETFSVLDEFSSLLLKWNQKINLVSKKITPEELWERHILDSAQLLKYIGINAKRIVDFGSGAGFPALILAILSDYQITVIESDQRKCAFMQEAVASYYDLSGKEKILYERYFLKITPDYEERVQKRGEKYELEKKFKKSDLSRQTEKKEISKTDFEQLKKSASKSIIREGYQISEKPNISIKIYHGDHEGLMRAEIEFPSETEANKFQPLNWMGKEITNTPLGKDSELIQLTKKQLTDLLKQLS